MKSLGILLLGLAAGCAATRPAHVQPEHSYETTSAAALAYDPPVSGGAPHPELARGNRGPSAFLGFDQPSTEYYETATLNVQDSYYGDYYIQQSLSFKSGVRVR